GHAGRGQAVLAYRLVHEGAEFPAQLRRDAVGAMEGFLRHAEAAHALQRALHLDALEALDLVARLDVVVRLHADAAFGVDADFVHVLLEATQRFQLAFENHHAVAQDADRLAALDHALDHHAAGDRAELGAAEHVADFGDADDLLADLLAQHVG